MTLYDDDLAWIHDAGFSDFVRRAAPGVMALLRRHGIEKGFVVDAGCGSGALSHALADAGSAGVGIDSSPATIALAKKAWTGGRFEDASRQARARLGRVEMAQPDRHRDRGPLARRSRRSRFRSNISACLFSTAAP